MRFMIRATMDTDVANALARSGKLGSTVEAIVAEQRPEAVYFVADGGIRTAYLFVDLAEPSDMPRIAEPWFLAFKARLEFLPAMSPADLQKAGPSIEAAAKKYG
jgi:hypothetical protein